MGLANSALAIGRPDIMVQDAFNEWGIGWSADGGSDDASSTD